MRFPQQFIPVCRRGKYVRRKDWVACRFHDHGDPSVALTAEARSWWRLADKTGRQIFRHASTVDAMAKGLSQGAPPAKARGAESKGKDASAHKKTVRVVEPNEVLESETNGANEDLDDEEAMHEGEDEAGISEKGIQRIMRALGDDGLSDFDLAALQSLYGEQGVEDEDDEDVDEEVENEEADESEDNQTDENEEEVDEVDEAGDEDEGEEEGDEDEGEKDIVDKEEEDEDEEPDGKAASAPKDSLAASILRSGLVPQPEDVDEDEDENEDEDEEEPEEIPLEAVPEKAHLSEDMLASKHNRVRINRGDALQRIYDDFRLDGPSVKGPMPWIETMTVTYPKTLADEVPDVQNDLDRELAFYRQSLDAAVRGRTLVLAANVPFSRPDDYFAEMVKTDEHMERVRQRLLDESAGIKASEDAKRQRELKKYGKKIQVEKLQERQRSKREMVEKVNELKRKRQGGLELDDDEFDVQLEDALADAKEARRPRPKMSRSARNDKFGFGGKKRYNKSNTAESLDDAQAHKHRGSRPPKGKGKQQRPGKSRRAARRS